VDMRPGLFAREEVEAEPSFFEHRWAHHGSLPASPNGV
jgi:hypothetical protein